MAGGNRLNASFSDKLSSRFANGIDDKLKKLVAETHRMRNLVRERNQNRWDMRYLPTAYHWLRPQLKPDE